MSAFSLARLRLPAALLLLASGLAAADNDDPERASVEAVGAAGGKVELVKNGSARAVFFRDSSAITPECWAQVGRLQRLRSLTLYNRCTLTDDTLPLLNGLTELEEAQIDGAHLTDRGMAGFAAWKRLRKITFFHVFWGPEHFNGTGLGVFAGLPDLESFGMGGSTLTDEGMAALGTVTQLKELHVWHTLVTDAGVAHLRGLTNLRKLILAPQFNGRITDGALPHVASLRSLETLGLGETSLSYSGGLHHLKQLPSLRHLDLDRVDITDDDLARLRAELPGVTIKHTPPTAAELEQLRRVRGRAPGGL